MPRDILEIASALKTIYESVYNEYGEATDLTEMKMHKLLYFAQKKHFENFGEWLFDDDFEGWVHGPVNRKVRSMFMLLGEFKGELTPEEEYTLREVVFDYGRYSAFYLRDLSHQDTAYKISRSGLNENEPGNTIILKENIIMDINPVDDGIFTDGEVH